MSAEEIAEIEEERAQRKRENSRAWRMKYESKGVPCVKFHMKFSFCFLCVSLFLRSCILFKLGTCHLL